MPNLSVLHRRIIIDDDEDIFVPLLQAVPEWIATITSLPGGRSPVLYWSPGASLRVMPKEWTSLDVQQLHSNWDFHRLSSMELSEEVYDQVISRIQSRSTSTPPPLDGGQ